MPLSALLKIKTTSCSEFSKPTHSTEQAEFQYLQLHSSIRKLKDKAALVSPGVWMFLMVRNDLALQGQEGYGSTATTVIPQNHLSIGEGIISSWLTAVFVCPYAAI